MYYINLITENQEGGPYQNPIPFLIHTLNLYISILHVFLLLCWILYGISMCQYYISINLQDMWFLLKELNNFYPENTHLGKKITWLTYFYITIFHYTVFQHGTDWGKIWGTKVVVVTNGDESVSTCIVVGDGVSMDVGLNIKKALNILIFPYYALDLTYPKQHQLVGFLQHDVLQDRKNYFFMSTSYLKFSRKVDYELANESLDCHMSENKVVNTLFVCNQNCRKDNWNLNTWVFKIICTFSKNWKIILIKVWNVYSSLISKYIKIYKRAINKKYVSLVKFFEYALEPLDKCV